MLKKIAVFAGTAIAMVATPAAMAKQESTANPNGLSDVPVIMPVSEPPSEEIVAGYGAMEEARNPFAGFEDFALKKPLIELPVADPARLKIADQVMEKLFSDGTYQRVMSTAQNDLMQPLLDRVWTMKGTEFAELFGIKEMPKSESDKTFAEAFGKDDPYAKQRIEAFMKTYIGLVGDMAGAIEPDIRHAMARDYARKYDVAQLTEMNTFFATPTGTIFARDYMTSAFSLDVLQTSLMVWPKMMKKVPDFATRLMMADADLPPRPGAKAVTDEFPLPKCAEDGDSSDCTEDDWTSAYADSAKSERDAWSKKDRIAVEKAEAKSVKIQAELQVLYTKVNAAQSAVDAATSKARKNAGQETYSPPIVAVPPPIMVVSPPAPTRLD